MDCTTCWTSATRSEGVAGLHKGEDGGDFGPYPHRESQAWFLSLIPRRDLPGTVRIAKHPRETLPTEICNNATLRQLTTPFQLSCVHLQIEFTTGFLTQLRGHIDARN